MEETKDEGFTMETTPTPVEEEAKPKTEEELAAEEGELDISNPDATPHKYNIYAAELHTKVNAVVAEIMEKYIEKSELPIGFVEIIPQVLQGKIKVLESRMKKNEVISRLTNKFKLTPVKDQELYETIEESRASIENLDSEELI